MRFYQVDLIDDGGGHAGYQWFSSKREADSSAATWRKNSPGDIVSHAATITPVDIKPTKAGILQALRRYANHADNG